MLLWSGCTVGPDYTPPEIVAPASFTRAELGEAPQVDHWVEAYGDPYLSELVRRSAAANHSLRALLLRVQQARAFIRSERSEGLPQVDAGGSYARFENSENLGPVGGATGAENSFSASALATWELDVFGRVRRLVEAARADADETAEAYNDLLLLTETEVAAVYFQLRAIEGELQAVEGSVETRRSALEIVRNRFDSGSVSDLDVAQAETLLALSEADLADLRRSRDLLVHALAVLLAEPAPDYRPEYALLDGEPVIVPAGIPSELLLRRPDLRQAEQAMREANARLGVSVANFYPRFTLVGEGGFASLEASDWFESASGFYSVGPQVSAPLFLGGRLRAEREVAEFALAEAVELYKQAVIEAFAEVEDALSGARYLAEQRAALERAAQSARRAQRVSDEQYRSGVIAFITALDSEREALDAERALFQVIGAQYENSVLLIRAIGGSWGPLAQP
ncbi:MAG: efflux transporter outer membrane subunit [Opitutales bacterium]